MKNGYRGFFEGDTVKVNKINDIRKDMEGKTGVIELIDDAGQLHTSISSVALIPEEDSIILISGIRNGNRIFKTSSGYVTFFKTSYATHGTAIAFARTNRTGKIVSEPEVMTVNLISYGFVTMPNQVVIHHDYLALDKEIIDIFIDNFCGGNSEPIAYGFAKSCMVTIEDDSMELLQELM